MSGRRGFPGVRRGENHWPSQAPSPHLHLPEGLCVLLSETSFGCCSPLPRFGAHRDPGTRHHPPAQYSAVTDTRASGGGPSAPLSMLTKRGSGRDSQSKRFPKSLCAPKLSSRTSFIFGVSSDSLLVASGNNTRTRHRKPTQAQGVRGLS